MDDADFCADEENEEQVGPGGGSADRAVRGNNESTEDSDEEDEDENEDGSDEDEGVMMRRRRATATRKTADTGMSHFTVPAATVNMPKLRFLRAF
eukprot:jgi/Tetstr1/457126/TSEL_043776.t1